MENNNLGNSQAPNPPMTPDANPLPEPTTTQIPDLTTESTAAPISEPTTEPVMETQTPDQIISESAFVSQSPAQSTNEPVFSTEVEASVPEAVAETAPVEPTTETAAPILPVEPAAPESLAESAIPAFETEPATSEPSAPEAAPSDSNTSPLAEPPVETLDFSSSELNDTQVQPESNPAQTPEKPKKKKTGLLIAILVILLLLGGGFVAFYFLVLRGGMINRDAVVSNFVDTAFYASKLDTTTDPKNKNLGVSGKISLDSQELGTASLNLDSKIGDGNLSLEIDPELQFGDDPMDIGKLHFLANSEATYFKTDNFNLPIPFFGELLESLFSEMSGKWYTVSLSDVSDAYSLVGDGSIAGNLENGDCIKEKVFDFLKTVRSDLIEKKIVTLSDYEGNLKAENGTLFLVSLNPDAFVEFMSEVPKKLPIGEIAVCMGIEEEEDSSEYTLDDESKEKLRKTVADLPELTIEANNEAEITRIYLNSSFDSLDVLIDLKITYPDSVKIDAPEDAKPFSEVTKKIGEILSGMMGFEEDVYSDSDDFDEDDYKLVVDPSELEQIR